MLIEPLQKIANTLRPARSESRHLVEQRGYIRHIYLVEPQSAHQFLAAVVRSGKPALEVEHVMIRFPQTLINVRDVDKNALEGNEVIDAVVAQVKAELGNDGSVLLRPSGTEPVVRVMVQALDQAVANEAAQRIADVVTSELHI